MPSNPFNVLINKIKQKREDKLNEKKLIYYCEYCKKHFDYTNRNDTHRRWARAKRLTNKHPPETLFFNSF